MPFAYKIVPAFGLVFIRFSGIVTTEDSLQLFRQYDADPGQDFTHRFLVDMSDLTGVDVDWPAFMGIMAKGAEIFPHDGPDIFVIYVAPTPLSLEHALRVARSWDAIPKVTVRVLAHEAEALAILGLAHINMAEIWA